MQDVDQLLNGGFARPIWGGGTGVAPLAESPARASAARNGAVAGAGTRSTSQAVLLAWIVLAVLLVLAHVVTFEVQR